LRSVLLSLCLVAAGSSAVHSGEELHTLRGRIYYPGRGSIHVFLVEREGFKVPLSGLQTAVLAADGTGVISFQFRGVPSGVYGIRAFQDANGNGKLDGGVFGPQEPWGMSWRGKRLLRWPEFSHISFTVGADTPVLEIQLK